MGSEYKRNSPSANLLNVGHLGNTPSYSGGSQTGSEYNFGNANSPSLDSMLQSGSNAHRFTTSTLPDHRSNLPMHNYGGAYDAALYAPNVSGNASNTTQNQSPSTNGRLHRQSIGSNGPFDGSDTTSQRGHGNYSGDAFGENSGPNNGNDMSNEHGLGDDDSGKPDDPHAVPAWSELKTKAGKERKRLPLACIACRRKKIRCSGEKPACKHCLRSRIPCVYKVTTRKAAPRTDYMAMLDKRLKRMEDRVIRIIPKEDQGIVASTGRSNVKPAIPPAPPKAGVGARKRGAEQAFDEELDDWASTKVGDPTKKNAATDASETEPMKTIDADEHSLLREGADQLPPKDLQQHLAEVFFDYVYGQSYHLLHKPSFMRKLAQDQVPPVLMLAVCAMSARYSNHPHVRTEPAFLRGEQWAKPAREISLRRYDQPNITILIVYLILGLHEFGTCQGGRSWMFGGMAQRMAYALQLHQDLDHDPKRTVDNEKSELTFTDREIRRRTMWSCFLLDRFSSSGTDRPAFVGPEYIRAQLPIREKLFNMEITGPTEDLQGNVPNPVDPETGQVADARENMGVAAYTIRLVAVWGDVINYMNLGGKQRDQKPMWDEDSAFQRLRKAADDWKDTLPAALQYTPENLASHASDKIANQYLFMHIVYNQIMLFMNRFALPTPGQRAVYPKEMPDEFVSDAQKAALEAANAISALVHEGMDHTVVAPFAGYAAFFSSTVHIHGAFSQNPTLEASSKQNLAWNVKYLTKMKKHWGMFHFVTENLRDLYRKHADAAKSGALGKVGKEGEYIFQYGDWFDRYPHGVSGTDFEEPQAETKKDPGADAVLGQQSDLQTVEEFFSKLSPPSRATANAQSQQKARKSRKKQDAKADNNKAGPAGDITQKGSDATIAGQQAQLHQQQHQQQQMPQSLQHHPQHMQQQLPNSGMDQQQHYAPPYTISQHSSAFPPGFQPPPNPLLMQQQHGIMSQLDRQMVLSSYGGSDQNPSAIAQQQQQDLANSNPMIDSNGVSMHDNFDGSNFNPLASTAGGANSGYWGDPSSAWFMPFNMDPPTMADDNNLLTTGGFDWPNTFTDFGSMPPTGMTPTPVTMDLDTGGQDGHGGGMDSMR
jgi:hypothetical protein